MIDQCFNSYMDASKLKKPPAYKWFVFIPFGGENNYAALS